MADQYRFKGLGIPLFPGFKEKILPVLLVYWIVAIALAAVYSTGLPLVLAGWLSPTTIMLWPIGRRFGIKYREYRSSWFIVSVLSMAGVPLTVGWVILTPVSYAVTKYFAIVTLVALVIGFFGAEVAHRGAFGKPVKMFFRPDLILGVNRILAGGLAAIAIGMKFMFTNAPPGDIPNGNWYAFFLVIILGLYQLIPLRGLAKLRTMVSRILYDKSNSYGLTALKELYLVVAITAALFSMHNFFGGVVPFSRNVLAGSIEGTVIMLVSGALSVLLRAGYKKRIGDPFFKETLRQSNVKDLILVIFMTIFFYGFINVMVDGFPRGVNTGPNLDLTLIGLGLYTWGVILLIPLRAWARREQTRGILRQMVNVMLPSMSDGLRAKVMGKVMNSVSELPEDSRLVIVRTMASSLAEMEDRDRAKVVKTQLQVLSSLPPDKRITVMRAMDRAMMH